MTASSSTARPLARVRPGGPVATGPLIVEFVGLPGAGKSTIAEALLPHLLAAGYEGMVTVGARMITTRGHLVPSVRGAARARRSVRHAGYLLRRPALVRAVVGYGADVRPRSIERLGFVWSILDYAFLLSEHQARPADVIVLDQASLQAAWSVVVRGSPPKAERLDQILAGLHRCASGQWAVAHFDVDQETALARIAARPTNTSRFDHMALEEARALLPGLARHARAMVDELHARGVPCIQLDARQPMDTTCSALMHFVHALRPSPAPGGRSG